MQEFKLPILVSKAPVMVKYFMSDGVTCTSTLLPYPWDHKTIQFIKDNNIQVGEELKKRILIPQWAESLNGRGKRMRINIGNELYWMDWEEYQKQQEFYGKF